MLTAEQSNGAFYREGPRANLPNSRVSASTSASTSSCDAEVNRGAAAGANENGRSRAGRAELMPG